MDINTLEWIGYIASALIAISMTMNSILKFRWINLAGATIFAIYGYLIGALPVGILNTFIVMVHMYYLISFYTKEELFEILEVRPENRYMIRFLEFHNKDIQRFFPGFGYKQELNTVSFFTLRNMEVAGVFLAQRAGENTLKVELDYVLPKYRDFKNGRFIYGQLIKKLTDAGPQRVISESKNKKYTGYLKKLGFVENADGLYEKTLS